MREIVEICERDHRRIQNLLRSAEKFLALEHAASANRALVALARRLKTHLAIEEELCFPAWTTGTRDHSYDLVLALTHDHHEMRERIENAREHFVQGDFRIASAELSELNHLFLNHVAQEENVIFPVCERVLPPWMPADRHWPPSAPRRFLNAASFLDHEHGIRHAAAA
jgi:iron-sulfur cluster repair protein YtfE (RIC family)